MALKSLRTATRHMARYREVFGVLARYGFSDWVNRVEFDFAREILERKASKELLSLSSEQRVRMALMELGPTFIKLGQFLSVRPDIVGVTLAEELKLLQSDVRPDPPEVARHILEKELKSKVEDVFEDFDPVPVASASIGQVHKAVLKTGETVAVKVRRKGIEDIVSTDMEILADIAAIVENYITESRYYRPRDTVAQFTRVITREMDFLREARHIINLGHDLRLNKSAKIPKVYEGFTTSKVLIMEWLDGKQLNQLKEADKSALNLPEVAEKVAKLYLEMIFVNGFYHADPHPGNIMIMPDGRLGLLDFGMAGRLSVRLREYIEDLVPVIIAGDSDRLARIIIKAGSLPPTLDQVSLGSDLSEFIAYYGSIPVMLINLEDAINEAVSIIHKHHIILPSEVIVLLKTLMTLDGTNRALSPEFSLISLIAPYQKRFAASILSPGRALKRTRRLADSVQDFLETAPPAMADILERFRKETLEIHMEHRGLEHSANRLVFGILTAAIFIGSSMLLSSGLPPKILGLSALGLLGYLISLFMGIRIMWAIWISGRLE